MGCVEQVKLRDDRGIRASDEMSGANNELDGLDGMISWRLSLDDGHINGAGLSFIFFMWIAGGGRAALAMRFRAGFR